MKVVILCGGRGFRLQEETEYKPKPLVTIGNKPILWHIMSNYAKYGFKEFVLCLGYKGEMIKEYFSSYDVMSGDVQVMLGENHNLKILNNHSEQNYNITLADTGLETPTGGRVKRIKKYVDDVFMLTYGDGVANINVKDLLDFHYSHGKIATITAVHPVSRYGVLKISDNNRVELFSEKPVENDWVSAGFFVFDKRIFDYLDDSSMEDKPLRDIANDGQLMAYKHEKFFYSMDTYRDYKHLNDMWDRGDVKWMM